MDLPGKGILVAGGAGNLGRVVVRHLRERGARVVVIDAAPNGATTLGDPDVGYVQADAADESAIGAAVGTAVEQLTKIDALVNCTGTIHSEPLINLMSPTDRRHRISTWDAVIRSNLTASFLVAAHVAEHMAASRTKGVIVNFSSVAAAGNPGQTAYAAAKAGVEAMTVVWARELGPLGIRVVAIAPGFVDTPSTHAALTETAVKEWTRRTPLRRLATADEIARTVAFAIESTFLTGRTIHVDGGLTV